MKRRALPFLILVSVGCGDSAVSMPEAPQADGRLTFSTPRRDYLLGEPVPLDLSFRNLSKEPIKVVQHIVKPGHYEAPVWIAREGAPFEEFLSNSKVYDAVRPIVSLEPGEKLVHKYRVLLGRHPENELAFAKPGLYRVYAEFPLSVVGDAQKNGRFASPVVEVRLKEPIGEDAKVWRILNEPSFLRLLQIDEELTEKHKDTALRLLDILAAHPKSGYAPALRHTLSKVSHLHHSLTFADTVRLEEIVGLKGFVRVEEDPKDKRLDIVRQASFAKGVTLENALRALTKESGVPLDASPDLRAKEFRMADSVPTVRECMRT